MWFLASWAGRIVGLAIVLVGVVVGAVAIFWLSDGAIEADVVEKDCGLARSTVTVETRWFGIRHTADVDRPQCEVVPQDGFVKYHVRSGRTVIYEAEGGECIWDTGSALGAC